MRMNDAASALATLVADQEGSFGRRRIRPSAQSPLPAWVS
jgi:hypothetical protein